MLSIVCGTIVIAAPDLALGIYIAINVYACFDSKRNWVCYTPKRYA